MGGSGGFNSAIFQLTNATSAYSYGYYPTETTNPYPSSSSAGIYNIPASKIVLGSLATYDGGVMPLSNTNNTSGEYSMQDLITDLSIDSAANPASPVDVNPPSSSPAVSFSYSTIQITNWYNYGGIMVYDIESTSSGDVDTGDSNSDVWAYFSGVASSR